MGSGQAEIAITDGQLLAQYVASRSPDLLGELIRRHAALVYDCCLRQLGVEADAEDAAQATFLVLLNKAHTLPAHTVLAGWLVRTATLASCDLKKLQLRRIRHEREAAVMNAALNTPDQAWQAIKPQLDAALADLPAAQRDALVLRYLQGCSRSQAALIAGCPERRLASRINLGLAKLRAKLSRRGMALSALLLESALENCASTTLPKNVLTSIHAACLNSGASSLAMQTAQEVIKGMFWMKLKLYGCTLALVALLAGAGLAIRQLQAQDGEPPVSSVAPVIQADDKPVHPVAGPSEAEALRVRFARYYAPVPVRVLAKVPQYTLPLVVEKLANPATTGHLVTAELRALVVKNGFAADAPTRFGDRIESFYEDLKKGGTPVFVTSDSLLHLYHIQFDETLRDIEEREFYRDALVLAHALYGAALQQAQELNGVPREAALLNAAYFAVALECLAVSNRREAVIKAKDDVLRWDGQDRERLQECMAGLTWLEEPGFFTREEQQALDRGLRKKPLKERALIVLDKALAKLPPEGREIEYSLADGIKDAVAKELVLIAKHEGDAVSPIFKYREDYSQYLPRGHYTRSDKLKRYFKALMWLGRMTALLKGGEGALVSAETARVQTSAGVLAAELLEGIKLSDGRSAREVWERIYAVTAFYVGFADDLTPCEYRTAARKVFGERFKPQALAEPDKFKALQIELARLRGPAIYSGTGGIVGPASDAVSDDELLKALEKTKGFRLLGQRYIPDSYMLGKLVYPSVGPWGGADYAFSTVKSVAGVIRGFPRGLDVLAVLGSVRAKEILTAEGDDNYVGSAGAKSYDEALASLRSEFEAIDNKRWNQNLYWSWLYCLKALVQDAGAGYPSFMQTAAWKDKQLNAAAGSWSQLRHDTILYAKPSYTADAGAPPREPQMVEGYVEPVPEFYARVLALTRMTRQGLGEFKVLSPEADKRLAALEQIVLQLLDISVKELGNEFLNQDDYDFIRNFGENLGRAVAGIKSEGLQTSIVADVHTDGNSHQVLEEGTGNIRPLWVVYPMPDGSLVLGCGPAFSYYEFKQPMNDRLTDDKWRQLLRTDKAPALPKWTNSFGVGTVAK